MSVYTAFFILCLLISLAPLRRFAGETTLALPTDDLLTLPGSWLPIDLHFAHTSPSLSQWTTHMVLFLACTGLAFLFYLLGASLLARHSIQGDFRNVRRLIWLVTIVLGLILTLMPAMLSHDIYAYASYGRVLMIYGANPYVTTLAQFPQDIFYRLNDWLNVPTTYGPVWQGISNILALIAGEDVGRTILLYRLFALAAHLLNVALIARILHSMGRSPRTIALGMLLYAWNPLVLEESSLSGHNDVFMITLLLLGLLFDVQLATQRKYWAYLPTLISLTLAMLVKLAAAPLLALYLVLLARRAYSTAEAPLGQRLKKVALTVTSAGLMSGVTALVLYLPYWQGWTLEQILFTFTSTPASQSSNGSILYAIVVWNREHPLPEIGSWVYYLLTIFGQHRTWNIINAVTMGGALLVGAIWIWRSASTRTLALAGLATLGTVLIVTSWFYPWYITWIAGLAVIVLPVEGQRVARMWLAFTLVFSASAFGVYLYANYLSPLGGWNWASCIVVLLPPLLTLLLFRLLPASGVSNE